MKITITGLVACGKTEVKNKLAEQLGYTPKSVGDYMREKARERGMEIEELIKSEGMRQIDRQADAETAEYGRTHDNFVFEGRLTWRSIPDAVHILLVCRRDVRAERRRLQLLKERGLELSLEEVRKLILDRDHVDRQRYKEEYGIDNFAGSANFDYQVDNSESDPMIAVNQIRKLLVI